MHSKIDRSRIRSIVLFSPANRYIAIFVHHEAQFHPTIHHHHNNDVVRRWLDNGRISSEVNVVTPVRILLSIPDHSVWTTFIAQLCSIKQTGLFIFNLW